MAPKVVGILLLLLCSLSLSAQRIGLRFGYGGQELLQVNYQHQAYLLYLEWQQALWEGNTWQLHFHSQAQYGRHHYRPVDSFPDHQLGYEHGLAVGWALHYRPAGSRFSPFFQFEIGPQQVKGLPSRQASGLVFNTTLGLGLHYWWQPRYALRLHLGFRHWSNAGLRQPNGGVDHLLWSLGLLWRSS